VCAEIRKVAGNVLLLLTADLPISEQDIFIGLDKNGLDLFETIVAEDIRYPTTHNKHTRNTQASNTHIQATQITQHRSRNTEATEATKRSNQMYRDC
jgi:hypothetical protein